MISQRISGQALASAAVLLLIGVAGGHLVRRRGGPPAHRQLRRTHRPLDPHSQHPHPGAGESGPGPIGCAQQGTTRSVGPGDRPGPRDCVDGRRAGFGVECGHRTSDRRCHHLALTEPHGSDSRPLRCDHVSDRPKSWRRRGQGSLFGRRPRAFALQHQRFDVRDRGARRVPRFCVDFRERGLRACRVIAIQEHKQRICLRRYRKLRARVASPARAERRAGECAVDPAGSASLHKCLNCNSLVCD